jgi:hypothetical protein
MKRESPNAFEILAGARPPAGSTREDRVRLIGEAAQQMVDSGTLAGLFCGGALLAWLENGGDLARDYLRVVKAKSHVTPAAIWRELRAHQDEGATRKPPVR